MGNSPRSFGLVISQIGKNTIRSKKVPRNHKNAEPLLLPLFLASEYTQIAIKNTTNTLIVKNIINVINAPIISVALTPP